MKCLVLIMGCNVNPGIRNVEAIKNSYIKNYNDNKQLFEHEYVFYDYVGGASENKIENDTIFCTSGDGIYETYQKTIEAFNTIINEEFDYLIRVNISTYINLFVIDKILNSLNSDNIYCNRAPSYVDSEKFVNKFFPRGDAYIINKKRLVDILNVAKEYNAFEDYDFKEKCDDALLGVLLLKTYGKQILDNIITFNYTFIPNTFITHEGFYKSMITPFSRLKTCPPNTTSGYSWNDNEYRLYDIEKMFILNDFIYNHSDFYNTNYEKYKQYLYADENVPDNQIKINNEIKAISLNDLKIFNREQ